MTERTQEEWLREIDAAFNGSGTWFTSHLLRLIAKADQGNRERLRMGFPDAVAAYERWYSVPYVPTEGGDEQS